MDSTSPARAQTIEAPEGRWARFDVPIVAVLVVAFVGVLWGVRGEPGMTWDEPYFFERSQSIGGWMELAVRSPTRAFTRAELEKGWPFCREVPDQHPPVPAALGLTSEWALGPLVGHLRGYRLATVGVFALAAGVMFRLVRSRWGPLAAVLAVLALVSDPRPFAHAQLITADSDLGAFWFLAAVAHLRAAETGRGAWWFGVFAGLAVMCKATGVLLLVAALAWAVIHRPRGGWRPLFWGVLTMPATMVLVNPAWWIDPVGGMVRWGRAFLAYPQKVPVAYLGKVYDSITTFLPWHNTAVLTATMVPMGLLILGALGLGASAWCSIRERKGPAREPGAMLPDGVVGAWASIHFLTYLVLRMFPFLPAHDGLRQVVPAYYFLPVLVALGARTLAGSGGGRARSWIAGGLASVCVLVSAWESIRVQPFGMSYYNAAIGGPRGAKAAGMETTYFWDSATDEVLDWMNANLPRGATVLIFPPPNVLTFEWEQRWGRLRGDLEVLNLDGGEFLSRLSRMYGDKPCYLIFQMRQGLYLPRPGGVSGFFARLARAPATYELAPARVDGVRLLAIYDREAFRAVAP